MRYLNLAARIIVGSVFIFSGFVKAVDPLGSAYKFHDYFMAFNLGFLDFLALPLAILLSTAEFVAGVSVLLNLRFRTGISLVMLLMILFTPLTLVLALTNPVSDCGCFGDAVHLTNWQTFGKNVVLVLLASLLWANRKHISPEKGGKTGLIALSAATLLAVLFSLYNIRYLPVIDFLPYKTGTVIAEKMVIPEGAPVDVYNTTFIYEKDGVRKEFTLENYPANDSSWKFIDQKSVLVKKGYVPPIHDFAIADSTGNDISGELLERKGHTFLMISGKLEDARRWRLEAGLSAGMKALEAGASFHILTSSSADVAGKYRELKPFLCSADATTLKTIVRANPGYLLISDGKITGKWSWANLPGRDELADIIRNTTVKY